MKQRLFYFTAAVCLMALTGLAVDVNEISFDVAMKVSAAPKIDGALDDACWKEAVPHEIYYEYVKPRPMHKFEGTKCLIVYDENGLYVGVLNSESNVKGILQKARKNQDRKAMESEDVAELYFDTAGDGVGFYKFVVNSLGFYSTIWRMDPNNPQPDWKADGIVSAAKIFDDRWELELFVPWRALHDRAMPVNGETWRFNHSRFRFAEKPWDLGSSAVMASFFSANRFGYLQFCDGTKPKAKQVLDMIEKKVGGYWAVGIGGKSYLRDEDGIHELSKSISETLDELDAADKAADAQAQTNINSLATAPIGSLEKLELRLAGTYDLAPPKEYDGHNGWFRWNPSQTAYPTPHLEWAPKTIGGAAKTLFITGKGHWVRDAVELCQRCELAADIFPGPFGYSSIFADLVSGGLPLPRYRQFETMLAKNPEVVAIHYIALRDIPVRYRYELIRRVHDDGMGLVIQGGPNSLRGMIPDLTHLKPVSELKDTLVNLGAEPKRINAYVYGKGRVIAADIPGPASWDFNWKADYETRSTFFLNAIRLASGRDAIAHIRFFSNSPLKDELFEGMTLYPFTVEAEKSGSVRYRVRNAENDVLFDRTESTRSGKNAFAVDISQFPGGDYWLDVIPQRGDKCDLVGVRKFSVPGILGGLNVNSTNSIVVAEDKTLDIPIDWEKPIPRGENWSLEVLLRDMPYRQIRARQTFKLGANSRSVKYRLGPKPFPTKAGCIDARLVRDDGKVAATKKKLVFFPNHRYEDYAMICWDGLKYGNLSEFFAPPLMEEIGYVNHLSSGNLSAIFNGRALPYSTRVQLGAGEKGTTWGGFCPIPSSSRTDPAVKEWWDNHGHDLNVKRPEIRAELEKYFSKTVKASVDYGTIAWSFGDECGFSSDIGFGDETSEGFYRDYLKSRYGTIEKYNAAHGTNITDFSEAKHRKTAESREDNDWVSWLDQMIYAEHLYADTYHTLASIIKKYDPKARCGAEGSPGGDLEYTLSKLEFWGPYRSLVNDELIRNVKPECLRGIWWGGYQRAQRDGFATEQWSYVLAGTLNADLWFQMDPASAESGMSSDFQPAPYVRKMLPTWRPLSRGQGALLCRVPMRKNGFAIHFSHASNHASVLSDEFPSAPTGNEALINFCYRNGFDVFMTTRNTLERMKGLKVLFLAGAVALDDAEIAAIAAFVKNGGKVYADCEPGIYNGYLAKRDKAPLAGLWTELKRGWSDEELLAKLDADGVSIKEKILGLPPEQLCFRIRELGDMTLFGFATRTANLSKRVEIPLGCEKYVYEADKGLISKTDKLVIEKLKTPHGLYSAFSEKQLPPVISLSSKEIHPGDEVALDVSTLRQGSVYRLEVIGPDGKPIKNREQVFCADAVKAPELVFQFPFSDMSGNYNVIVTDVATGLSGASVCVVQ